MGTFVQPSSSQAPKHRDISARLRESLGLLIGSIYPNHEKDVLVQEMISAFWPANEAPRRRGRAAGNAIWSEKDCFVITYGNSFVDGEHKPLELLHDFLENRLKGVVNAVHILPFFPYTSDDGFAITDYRAVNSSLGA